MEGFWDSIVLLSPYPWKGVWQTTHHLARYFTAHLPTLFVEFPPPWNPRARYFDGSAAFRGLGPARLRQVAPRVHVLTPPTLPLGRWRWMRQRNQKLYVGSIRTSLARLGFKRPLYWAHYLEGCVKNLEALGHAGWVYHCLDHMPRGDQNEERELLRRAGAVFTVSLPLLEKHRALNPRTFHFPNGVEEMWFEPPQRAPLPALADLPADKPVIGFLGVLFRHLDCLLLEKVADAFPSAELVMIGPRLHGSYGPSGDQLEALERLLARPGVRYLGFQPREDLPCLVDCFDVCLMPFLDNEFVRCSDPLKFYEYISRGKPVVTTPLPAVEPHRELCYIAGSHEEFLSCIEQALAEARDSPLVSRRIALARAHAWDSLVKQALECVGALPQT